MTVHYTNKIIISICQTLQAFLKIMVYQGVLVICMTHHIRYKNLTSVICQNNLAQNELDGLLSIYGFHVRIIRFKIYLIYY